MSSYNKRYNWVYLDNVSPGSLIKEAKAMKSQWQHDLYPLFGFLWDGAQGNSNTWACTVVNHLGVTFNTLQVQLTHLRNAPLNNCKLNTFDSLSSYF